MTPAVTAEALGTPAVFEKKREEETEEEEKPDQVFGVAHTARYVLIPSGTVL